ncbi:MAG: Gfo/Idh/MocA family oxidoreductase [Acidobacteria bacterium]|nr:Gfo/Idh/MocA family oxidoreductase [Acidobacteriota bacterium]
MTPTVHQIGLIGAGDVVEKAYLPILLRRADCNVIAICSRTGRSAVRLAERWSIPHICADHQDLLSKNVDTVFICTPTHTHRLMATDAVAAGKNVLVEKPLCTSYPEACELLDLAARHSGTFYTAFNNAFREENRWLMSRVLPGELGILELLDFEWYRTRRYREKLWLYDRELSGGGVLMDLGCHLIHLGLSLIPQRLCYRAYCRIKSHNLTGSVLDDTATATISINDSVEIVLKLGWDMKMSAKSRVRLEVFGSEGSASNQDYDGEKSDGFSAMIEDFLQHVREGSHPDLSVVYDSMKLLHALYTSAETNGTVEGEFGCPSVKTACQAHA